ncbi:MAG: hypothetical protein M1375_04195 [Candidatus Thermoplasmatota archaeon]|jgi:hypothetical protein|nr:hypothetical protein [Candidatus Thermoplasmatota archaeon]MCL5791156.1 hypothetical protein [Candidatus Thermoplasmatota archaeon]
MKISKMVSLMAFAILAAFLVISASSVYITTENDLKSIEMAFEDLRITNGTVFVQARLNGSNSGFLPSHVDIMNNVLTINPEASMSRNVSLPLNLTKMKVDGWSFHSIEYIFVAVVSEFLSGMNMSSDSQNISTLIPPFFTEAKLLKTNNSGGYELMMSGVIPIIATLLKVSLYAGNVFLGNLSTNGTGEFFSGTVSLIGDLTNSTLASSSDNLSFRFLGNTWNIPSV